MSDIKSRLAERAISAINSILESEGMPALRPADKHHRKVGKKGIVDRVRGGKVQYRKEKSDTKGYKLVNGEIVKMDPAEVRKRRIGGKISARKRRAAMGNLLRKRAISLKIRNARLA